MKRYLRGFVKVFQSFFRLTNRDRIARLPRHYATDYRGIDERSRRVMARLGIRSPDNLRGVMRRADIDDIDEFVASLRHYRPHVRAWRRFRAWIAAATGLYQSRPHSREYALLMKEQRSKMNVALNQRAADVKRIFEEK